MNLQIYSLGKEIFSGSVDSISLPTKDGQIEILPQHTPLIANLSSGTLSYQSNHKREEIEISEGIAEICSDSVNVLTN